MTNARIKYEFNAKPWKYKGKGGWVFISLPQDLSKEIRENLKWQEEGWGRLRALAKIGKTEWETAIWFDTKVKTYLLPLKAEVRKKEMLKTDEMIKVVILI